MGQCNFRSVVSYSFKGMQACLLGTALSDFRSCNPPWLRLNEGPRDLSHLGDKAYLPGRDTASALFHFTLLGPGEDDQLVNDG